MVSMGAYVADTGILGEKPVNGHCTEGSWGIQNYGHRFYAVLRWRRLPADAPPRLRVIRRRVLGGKMMGRVLTT